jgi:predicted AAA+ superfamily ATPase
LEKAFVVFRVNAFSRNMRNKIKNNRKIYFYDKGLRNALISNFNPLNMRNDKSVLWENFLISERIKLLKYQQIFSNTYFWRTSQQQEVDWIEEKGGVINAYEFKWKANERFRFPKGFVETYNAQTKMINRDNYSEFVM